MLSRYIRPGPVTDYDLIDMGGRSPMYVLEDESDAVGADYKHDQVPETFRASGSSGMSAKTLARQHTSVRRKHVSRKQFPNSFRSKLQSPHEAAIHSALSGSPFTSPNVFGSVNSCARASRAVIASCEEWFCEHLIACATLLRVVCLVRPCTSRRSRCVRPKRRGGSSNSLVSSSFFSTECRG